MFFSSKLGCGMSFAIGPAISIVLLFALDWIRI